LDFSDSFIDNENWSFINEPMDRRALVAMYFGFTSLSTVGLGDFYPVNSTERLVGSFVLLVGVAAFSYVTGVLYNNVQQVYLLQDNGDERELDRFFSTLKFYNNNFPIDRQLQNEITLFMKSRWNKHKNNFIEWKGGVELYQQLPSEV
jgi:hypothetical protein